jgi:PAS domain S-box-containing protein
MGKRDDEDERLRLVALKNAQSISAARRRAEADLRKQSEWLHVTLSSIGDAVISTDIEGRVTFMNVVAEALTGWKQSEALGLLLSDVFQIVNEQTREVVENPALRALSQDVIVGLANHTVLISRDGTERPIDDSAAPIRNDRGELAGVVLIFRDITERRSAERALTSSEQDLSDFFENASVGLHWVGSDGTILRVNQTELDMLGYEREEYVGRNIAEFHVDQSVIENILTRLTRGQTLIEYPARLRCKDGSIRDVLINSNVKFEDGTFIHTRCFTLDITDRKRAQDLLRQSEERLRFIMASMPQKIFTTKADGELDYVNPQWTEFSGLSFEQLKSGGWFQLLHPDDADNSRSAWQASIDAAEKFHFEHRFLRSDGEYRWHFSRAMPLRDDDGNVSMWVGSTTEIHAQKEASNRLRLLAADLSEADRRKNEFLAMLAHELRNPLAPIRNALQIIRLSQQNAAVVQSTSEIIERQVHHLVRLVDDLLDVSRISQGKIDLRRERVDLASALNQAVETCRPALDLGNHKITVSLPPERLQVKADPIRIAQVFSNLINNACKYSDPGSPISMEARFEADEIAVSVKDNGVGIPADRLQNIFEMFTQVEKTRERAQGGLGIGLTLVKELVQLHGGTVEANSGGLDKGSEFTVRLPRAIESDDPVEIPEPAVPLAKTSAARRILVVDDNLDAAESLSMMLQLCGNETYIANDGVEAVEAVGTFRPEVILMDIGLPRLDGYEAARMVRNQALGKDVVLIALTGWGNAEDRQRSKDAGFDEHLVKPVDYEVLLKVLNSLPGHGKS